MMNTNFAQILVSNLKMSSTKFKVGFLSLIFTFVFLGMGTTSHAQSLSTSDVKIDQTVLDAYSFKKDRGFVITTLSAARIDNSLASSDEVYTNLRNSFISSIITNLESSNLIDVRQAVTTAYYATFHSSKAFKSADGKLIAAVKDVSSLIN